MTGEYMLNFFKKLLDYNQKEIDRYQKRVNGINSFEDKARHLKDADFAKETEKLRKQIQTENIPLDEVVTWSFALVREAARRTLDKRHYDVQLIAGLALYEGKIAEQKTGEGKTLSATTALYTHALMGRGAHLVTVNDYLARRDAGWMGGVFHLLGMTTAAMISEQSFLYNPKYHDSHSTDWRLSNLEPISRQEAYKADITYGINSEFGFDYLRDNMAQQASDLVQRGYYFAVIDEADSVLIDEARTPHIISAPYEEDTSKYYKYAQIVGQLDGKEDYIIDEKLRTANLTEKGITHVEKLLGVSNIYEKDFETIFHIEAALKAKTLYKIDKEYIVKDKEVVIVDEFTGRLLMGRRFSEGIHQAIEAKENVGIKRESKNLATVSLQNYFRMYEKLAGMTGTATTEAEEFHKIYNTDVITVPTHQKMIRMDQADVIYKTEKGKFDAVVSEIAEQYKTGRPVLVGTTSIEKNEYLSKLLNKKGVKHELLNAKNHEREAAIIAKAGEKGAITVATNVAGRGVDIILGGESPSEYEAKGKAQEAKLKKAHEKWQKNHDAVVSLGGLYVIGTERHESRRIDNQLRGRSGRQGDPGQTKFFVSLEDDLMRIFGGEQIASIMTRFNFPEDQPLSHGIVSKIIEQAQVKVEGFNFDIRKRVVEYDDVLNKQREIIYSLRQKILMLFAENPKQFKETIFNTFHDEVEGLIAQFSTPELLDDQKKLIDELRLILPFSPEKVNAYIKKLDFIGLQKYIEDEIRKSYEMQEKKIGHEVWNNVVQIIFLTTIDKFWTEHLTAIDDLREGINLRGYAQRDPLVEYKNEAFGMFEKLLGDINFEFSRRIFRIEVEAAPHIHAPALKKRKDMVYKSATSIDPFAAQEEEQKMEASSPTHTHLPRSNRGLPTSGESIEDAEIVSEKDLQSSEGFHIIPPGTASLKIGRNDPCPCGSGLKYKKCGLINAPQHKG